MCVMSGMADATAAMATMDASAKRGNQAKSAAIPNAMAPRKKSREAAKEGACLLLVTMETTTGVRSKPTLLQAATAAFHNAPE